MSDGHWSKHLDDFTPGKRDLRDKKDSIEKVRGPATQKKPSENFWVLDLHGMTQEQAGRELGAFLGRCREEGVKKVLIIHGQGHHSAGGPVLKETVRRILESSDLVTDWGTASPKHGGSGAVWVWL